MVERSIIRRYLHSVFEIGLISIQPAPFVILLGVEANESTISDTKCVRYNLRKLSPPGVCFIGSIGIGIGT